MEKSDSIAALAAALAKAQSEFKPVKRLGKVDFALASGGRKRYSYALLSEILEACLKPLSTNGLAIMQPTRIEDQSLIVETWLAHSSGEWVKSEILIAPQDHSPQSAGSALTYARRYALSSLLGIASEEDDDGEAAQGKGAAAAVERKPAAPDPSRGPGAEAPPLCDFHKSALRRAKTGHWYCPIKDAEGHYCKYQVPKPTASPSPFGDVSPPPSDTQAPSPQPGAGASLERGQATTLAAGLSPSHEQPGPLPKAGLGGTSQDFMELFSESPVKTAAVTVETPQKAALAEIVGMMNWGKVAGAIENLGLTPFQVFARATIEPGKKIGSKKINSWEDMAEVGWTPQSAWKLAQELKKELHE